MVISHVSGELTRPSLSLIVTLPVRNDDSLNIQLQLPTFVQGDVGAQVWPAAMSLMRILVDKPSLVKDKHVLELGCGTASCGLVALSMGAKSLCATDFNQACLEASGHNIMHYNQRASTLSLDWSSHRLPRKGLEHVDIILGWLLLHLFLLQ